MKHLLVSLISSSSILGQTTDSTENPTARGQQIVYFNQTPAPDAKTTTAYADDFVEQDEVYRIHFYPQTDSANDEYVLYKRISPSQTQQVNSQEIPDPLYYMTRVAHELAAWNNYTPFRAQKRFVNSDFGLDYGNLWQYGCYGQMRPFKNGRGDPKDIFDEIYKEYHTCLSCVNHDYGLKNVPKYSFCYDLKSYKFVCPKDPERNTSEQWAQCQCDMALANKLAKIRSGSQDFVFNNEVVYEDDCIGTGDFLPNNNNSQKQCCGEYPKRFVYHTDGNKQCCGAKLFNSQSQKCCESSDIINASGSCPSS